MGIEQANEWPASANNNSELNAAFNSGFGLLELTEWIEWNWRQFQSMNSSIKQIQNDAALVQFAFGFLGFFLDSTSLIRQLNSGLIAGNQSEWN